MTAAGTAETPDAIVIGSGFGGAVMACRLAESGRRVLVLERGAERTGEDFPRVGQGPSSWLWNQRWNGLLDLRVFRRMATLTSSGVGGGSHVYANVHVRAPARSFGEGWPRGLDRDTLDPHYATVERMLGVRPLPGSITLEKTTAYEAAASRLGLDTFRPNLAVYYGDGEPPRPDDPPQYVRDPYDLGVDVLQSPCRHCGECDIGCTSNSKNTLDLNYLAVARQRHGAVIQPLSEVVRIEPERSGYRVHYRSRTTREESSVWAPLVVVSAGTVNTVELLLRCREEYRTLPNLSAALGRGFSGNADYLAAALNTREPLNPWHGPTITVAARFLEPGHQFYLEEGGFAPDLAFVVGAIRPRREYARKFLRGPLGYALRLRWFYKEVARFTGHSAALEERLPANTMIFLGMGEDGSDGRIRLRRRLPRLRRKLDIQWNHDRSRPVIERIDTELRRVTAELGGEYVTNPLWSVLGRLITVHPLGGCALSDDPSGVVGPYGEVWGYPNLFVADGSVIPRAIGPNPALTIAALAERSAAHIVGRG